MYSNSVKVTGTLTDSCGSFLVDLRLAVGRISVKGVGKVASGSEFVLTGLFSVS